MERVYPGIVNRIGSVVSIMCARLTGAQVQIRFAPASPVAFSLKILVFLRFTIGLVGCLTAVCILAIAGSRAASIPNPISRIGLGRCGAELCFSGATPGLTDWAKAETDFALVKHSQLFEHQIFVHFGSDGGAALYPSTDNRTVGLVYITVPSSPVLTVGDVVNQYGPPCVLTLPGDSGGTALNLYYPYLTVIAADSFVPETPVKYIVLNDPAGLPNMPTDSCPALSPYYLFPNIAYPWHGFASLRHYQEAR